MAQETWQGTWGHDWRVGESELAGNKRILWIHSCAAAAGWYADVGVILPSHHGLIYIHIHYVLAVIGRLSMGKWLKELNPNPTDIWTCQSWTRYLSVEAHESLPWCSCGRGKIILSKLKSHHGLIYIHIHYVLAVIGRLYDGRGTEGA